MGSITLDRSGTSVTLTKDLRVVRTAGRPNGEIQRIPGQDLPQYRDLVRASSDVFEISGVFTSSSAAADAQTLRNDIIRSPLGTDTLTLTFDNSLYTLDSYTVFPVGSRAVRVSHTAGAEGMVFVDGLNLQVVGNS